MRVVNAVLFIPEAAPWVDVYGKVGAAMSTNRYCERVGLPGECAPGAAAYAEVHFTIDVDQTDWPLTSGSAPGSSSLRGGGSLRVRGDRR